MLLLLFTVSRPGAPVISALPRLIARLTGWVPITQFIRRHLVMDTSFTVRKQRKAVKHSRKPSSHKPDMCSTWLRPLNPHRSPYCAHTRKGKKKFINLFGTWCMFLSLKKLGYINKFCLNKHIWLLKRQPNSLKKGCLLTILSFITWLILTFYYFYCFLLFLTFTVS